MSRARPIQPSLAAFLAVVLTVLTVASPGCLDAPGGGASPTGTATPSPSPAPPPGPTGDCDAGDPLPTAPTWAAHGGTWATFVQAETRHPQGIRGAGAAGEPGLSLLVDHGTPASPSFDASVNFALVSGEHPDGAGLAFHWTGDSYNIVRYSPSEGGWHLFTVIDGERTKVNATANPASMPGPAWCQWTGLRVVAEGANVEVWQDGVSVLRASLPDGASTSGQGGLFLRGDTVALFDGYSRR